MEDANQNTRTDPCEGEGPDTRALDPRVSSQKRPTKSERRAARREERREKMREATRKKREERRRVRAQAMEAGVPLPPPRQKSEAFRRVHEQEIEAYGPTVVLDMAHQDLMTVQEVRSMAQQVAYCYAANRRFRKPFRLWFTSFGGPLRDRLARSNVHNWNVEKDERDVVDVFGRNRLVYLTADSPNTLNTLADDLVYVIGAFVDRNRHKGVTKRKADELGIPTARLPLDDWVMPTFSRVLTTNHGGDPVLEILLRFQQSGDWKSAIMAVLPRRKGVQAVQEEESEPETNDSSNTEQ